MFGNNERFKKGELMKKLLELFLKYGPIVISFFALFYSIKKYKFLNALRLYPRVVSNNLEKMDVNLENLGPGIACDLSATVFFIRFHNLKRRTLLKKEVYSLEYLSAKDRTRFSIDGDRFDDKNISNLFKWIILFKWRDLDNNHHSALFVFNNKKKRFMISNYLYRFRLLCGRFIHTSAKHI